MAAQPEAPPASFATLAERLCRSTVQVQSRRSGGGSGVIWHPDGLIVTNAHVARGSRATVELSDGRTLEATVAARDLPSDLAALKVKVTHLPAITAGNASTLRVGELVLAVGNPHGLAGALTTGIVHTVGSKDTFGSPRWVQADVRLAPGNSGGPLADAEGRVIGINSRIVDGLALAIPSNTVARFLRNQEWRPDLGIITQPVLVPLRDRRVIGLLVCELTPSSPAEAAGLLIGDVLTGVGGQCFQTLNTLISTLQETSPNARLELELLRGGNLITCSVVVGGTTGVEEM